MYVHYCAIFWDKNNNWGFIIKNMLVMLCSPISGSSVSGLGDYHFDLPKVLKQYCKL